MAPAKPPRAARRDRPCDGRIGRALTALGAAYEQLDEATGDRLEEELFRPVQVAFGRARRTDTGFAERHGLDPRLRRADRPACPRRASAGFVERAQDAAAEADDDPVRAPGLDAPVEFGDAELRAGLADVREHLADVSTRSRELIRIFGR